jgi:hypothetical protein
MNSLKDASFAELSSLMIICISGHSKPSPLRAVFRIVSFLIKNTLFFRCEEDYFVL